MKEKWFQSSFKNIQFKKHPTRKHGIKFDRYFRGSYQVAGKRKAINFGWESEGWSESLVWEKINFYKKNTKTGSGPTVLKEERDIEDSIKIEDEKIQVEQKKSGLLLKEFFYNKYYPQIQKEKKAKTYQREESLFRMWIDKNLGHLPFNKITKTDIENIYYDIIESGKSIRSAEYALTTLKQIWREAEDSGYAPGMPSISKSLKKKISQNNNARIRFLSQDEADALLDALKERSMELYEKALISLHCGLRAKEIFTLTWGHVDLEHGILNIIDSKGKDRSVHMSEQIKEMLLSKDKGNPEDLVYPGRENKVSGQISQTFRQIANKLFNQGVDDRRNKVIFHSLRHSCASWMVMQGVNLYLVQKVLGHSTIQVTERYAHLAPDQLQLAANAIDKITRKKGKVIPFPKRA